LYLLLFEEYPFSAEQPASGIYILVTMNRVLTVNITKRPLQKSLSATALCDITYGFKIGGIALKKTFILPSYKPRKSKFPLVAEPQLLNKQPPLFEAV